MRVTDGQTSEGHRPTAVPCLRIASRAKNTAEFVYEKPYPTSQKTGYGTPANNFAKILPPLDSAVIV